MSYKYLICGVFLLITTTVALSVEVSGSIVEVEKTRMVAQSKDDIIVTQYPIVTSSGSSVGARIEVVNQSPTQNLVIVVPEDLSRIFEMRLFNKDGIDVAPMVKNYAKTKDTGNLYQYETVPPRSSRCWFLNVPKEVRANARKMSNEGNLQPIPSGDYTAEIKVMFSYFLQERSIEKLPTQPPFNTLKMVLPRFKLKIVPIDLELDIFQVYAGIGIIDNFIQFNKKDKEAFLRLIYDDRASLEGKLLHYLSPEIPEEVQYVAAFLLGYYRMDEAVNRLADFITLHDEEKEKENTRFPPWGPYPAEEALVRIGLRAVPRMIENIKTSPDEQVRSLSTEVVKSIYGIIVGKFVLENELKTATDEVSKQRLNDAILLMKWNN